VEGLRIEPAADAAAVVAAQALFDDMAKPEAVARFLAEPTHHMLIGYADGQPVGFVSGVEMTHPDKGTEMFLYELAVGESSRNRGVGRALVTALAEVGRERGCYGMWVLTDDGNPAALRAYAAAGGVREQPDSVLFSWTF
jgi:ribosomal protein S18 acetylase RimI-like enzyme